MRTGSWTGAAKRQLCFRQGASTRFMFCICDVSHWSRLAQVQIRNDGVFMGTLVPLRGRAEGRAAGPQHLGCRAALPGVFLQGVFGQPRWALLEALLGVLVDCVFRTICRA